MSTPRDYELIERPARDLVAYLTSQAAVDKLAEVAARYTGEQALSLPLWSVEVDDPRQTIHLPHLYIVPSRTRDEGDGLYPGARLQLHHEFEFAVLASSPEPQGAKWLTMRYLVALTELLCEMRDDPAYAYMNWGVGGPTDYYFQPTYSTQSSQLVGDARLITWVEVHE